MNEILNVILYIVFMLGIVGVCAFVFSIIIDAIMSMSDKHRGVYFNQQPVEDKKPNQKIVNEKDVVVYRIDAPAEDEKEVEFINVDPKETRAVGVNNLSAAGVMQEDEDDKFVEIDYDKAVEEQKLLQESKVMRMEQPKLTPMSAPHTTLKPQSQEFDFDKILDEVAAEAALQMTQPNFAPVSKVPVQQSQPNFQPVGGQPMAKEESQVQPMYMPIHQPNFQPLNQPAPAVETAFTNEIKELRQQVQTLRDEIVQAEKTSIAKDAKLEYEQKLAKELEVYRLKLSEKDKELDSIKNSKSITEIVNTAISGLTKHNQQAQEQYDDKIKELEDARKKYNQELAELEEAKAQWLKKEQELTNAKHSHEKLQLTQQLEESKKKMQQQDDEINKLRQDALKLYDRQHLDEIKQEWMAKEQELLYQHKLQKNQSNEIIQELKNSLEVAQAEISQKTKEVDRLQKDDSAAQRAELEELKTEWQRQQQQLSVVLENAKMDNQTLVNKLSADVEFYKTDIENKQAQIAALKKVEQDYTKERAELEQLKTQWQQKEQDILRVQEEQRQQDHQTIVTLKQSLKQWEEQLESKEQQVDQLKRQNADYSLEIKDLDKLKQELSDKEQQLKSLQQRLKEEDAKAIESTNQQLEQSKEVISNLETVSQQTQAEIQSKENQIEKMRNKKQDHSKYIKQLQLLKKDWSEKRHELLQAEERRKRNQLQLVSKIQSELELSRDVISEKQQEIDKLKDKSADFTRQQKELSKLGKDLQKRRLELEKMQRKQDISVKVEQEGRVLDGLRRPKARMSSLLQFQKNENPIQIRYETTAKKEQDKQSVPPVQGAKKETGHWGQARIKQIELEEAEGRLTEINLLLQPLIDAEKNYHQQLEALDKATEELAKKQIALYGVQRNKTVSDDEKAKLDKEVERVEKLKQSIHTSNLMAESNKEKFANLESQRKVQQRVVDGLKAEVNTLNEPPAN